MCVLEYLCGTRLGLVRAFKLLASGIVYQLSVSRVHVPVFPPPPSPFPLMQSLECLIYFDLMEKLYLPPLYSLTWGETLMYMYITISTTAEILVLVVPFIILLLTYISGKGGV